MSRITKNDLMALLRVLPEYTGMTDDELVKALAERAMEHATSDMNELIKKSLRRPLHIVK
jgi:hypothetical protein